MAQSDSASLLDSDFEASTKTFPKEFVSSYRSLSKLLDSVFTLSNSFLLLASPEGRIIRAGEKFVKQKAMAKETQSKVHDLLFGERYNQNWLSLFTNEDSRLEIEAEIKKTIENNTTNEFLTVLNLFDEGPVLMHLSISPLFDEEEAYAVLVMGNRSVDSEALQQIVQHMPIILVAWDKNKKIAAWNEQAAYISGFESKEVLGKNADQIFKNFQDFESALMYADPGARDKGSVEFQFITSTGIEKTILWYDISARFPVSGWKEWLCGIDISDRKHAENERFHLVQELTVLAERAQRIVGSIDPLYKKQTADSMGLSRRQKEVLILVLKGYTNKSIANELHISESSIKTHVAGVFKTLGVQSRVELLNWCSEHNFSV